MTITDEKWIVVVGDVHGDADRLSRFFDQFGSVDDVIVMVGDYVNRGPESSVVLDILCEQKSVRRERLVLLRGNHEAAVMTVLEGGRHEDFARHGGFATVKSYLGKTTTKNAIEDFRRSFPKAHLSLLQGTINCYVTPSVLVSHAGFDVDHPSDFGSEKMISGDKRIFQYSGIWPRHTVVVGHYLQSSRWPLLTENLIAIDTGCGTLADAPLTALRLPERSVFQF